MSERYHAGQNASVILRAWGMLEEMAAALPDAQLQVFEDSAHFPDTEQTAAYATAVPAFLDDHPSNAR